MINPCLALSRDAIAAFCRKHRIRRLSLFGSATREDFRRDSDVDVLLEFAEDARASLFDLVDLQDALSVLFAGNTVDVATPSILQNPFRRRTVTRGLETLYADE